MPSFPHGRAGSAERDEVKGIIDLAGRLRKAELPRTWGSGRSQKIGQAEGKNSRHADVLPLCLADFLAGPPTNPGGRGLVGGGRRRKGSCSGHGVVPAHLRGVVVVAVQVRVPVVVAVVDRAPHPVPPVGVVRAGVVIPAVVGPPVYLIIRGGA